MPEAVSVGGGVAEPAAEAEAEEHGNALADDDSEPEEEAVEVVEPDAPAARESLGKAEVLPDRDTVEVVEGRAG